MRSLVPAEVGVAFDFDDTLVHSGIDFAAAAREVRAQVAAWSWTGQDGAALANLRVADLVNLARARDAAAGAAGQGRCAARLLAIVERYERQGLARALPDPEAVTVLRALHERGHPLAVVTNNARAATREVLAREGLWQYLDALVAREDVSLLKPSGEGLRKLWARWQPRGVRRLVVVGDSLQDGRAAEDGGALFVALGRAAGEGTLRPWHRLGRLGELLELDLAGAGP